MNSGQSRAPAVVASINAAGFDIFRRAQAAANGNIMISPLSISMCLAMVEAGSSDDTKLAIDRAFHWSAIATNPNALPTAMGMLKSELASASRDQVQIDIANSVWLSQRLRVKPSFVALMEQSFGADGGQLDFADQAGVKNRINGWVKQKTNGLIPEIIQAVDRNAQFVLVSAICFKGQWRYPFSVALTEDRPFAAEPTPVTVPMMRTSVTTAYLKQSDIELVILPYRGPYQMVILLPPRGTQLASFVKSLSPERFLSWVQSARSSPGDVTIPKWKSDAQLDLNGVLTQMGMGRAFDQQAAQFRNLSDDRTFVSQVVHRTYIVVDEKGTEAAAVTAARGGSLGGGELAKRFEFVADRPFVYAIWNSENRLICFLGTVAKP